VPIIYSGRPYPAESGAAEGSQKPEGTEERGQKGQFGQSGSGVLGEGAASPHQVGGRLGEQWKLSSAVWAKPWQKSIFVCLLSHR